MIQAWSEFMQRPEIRPRVIFIMDYDIALAGQLVQGIDVWINTPRRPWEACGTSGMKVLVNGGLNLSETDGWWAEAYRPEVGWALGDGQEHGADPSWDAREAEQLYRILEEEIVPCFYDRDGSGIPVAWVGRIRASMAELTPRFSTNRMLREYVERLYLPAVQAYRTRISDGARKAVDYHRWYETLQANWPHLHAGKLVVQKEDSHYSFSLPIFLNQLSPDWVEVQLYAEPASAQEPEIHPMQRGEPVAGAANAYQYNARVPAKRPASDYTPRVIPAYDGAAIPLEAPQILWYE
jgi:starch phosphorylase